MLQDSRDRRHRQLATQLAQSGDRRTWVEGTIIGGAIGRPLPFGANTGGEATKAEGGAKAGPAPGPRRQFSNAGAPQRSAARRRNH